MNGVLKIITKILSIRRSKVLSSLITNTQSAFIKNKHINDSYLNVVEIITTSTKSKSRGLAFKLDFENAFDNVNWKFILVILKARGFSERWCKWIECILSSNKMVLLINGTPTRWINTKCGLKQGDLISPLLFILITDSLHRILLQAAKNKLLHGIAYSKITLEVLCLQYADDTMILNDDNLSHI